MTSLSNSSIIAFVPTTNLQRSKLFYESRLGLTLRRSDEFALEFEIGSATLRVTKVAKLTPAEYTVFGWEVDDIRATIMELLALEIEFERYSYFDQDELGVCTFPNGGRVAWFRDPDGNTLSITQASPTRFG